MYSAAMSSSSMVAARPRLRSTGRSTSPTADSSWKFCMLRAPIWMMSEYVGHVVQMPRVHELRHHGQAGRLPGFGQHLQGPRRPVPGRRTAR